MSDVTETSGQCIARRFNRIVNMDNGEQDVLARSIDARLKTKLATERGEAIRGRNTHDLALVNMGGIVQQRFDEIMKERATIIAEADFLKNRLADAVAQIATIRESKFVGNSLNHSESRALKWMNRALSAETKLNKVRLAYENGGGFGLIEAIKAL